MSGQEMAPETPAPTDAAAASPAKLEATQPSQEVGR